MNVQASLFDLMASPPLLLPVDADGAVVLQPDETLCLKHPKLAWDLARIELHLDNSLCYQWSGCWMWSASFCTECGNGHSYRVGPKWGKFARSRDDALFYAVQELRRGLDGREGNHSRVFAWLDGLQ